MLERKICFIGAGNMAEAMIKGVLARDIITPKNIFCYDIEDFKLKDLNVKYGIEICNNENIKSVDVFILAIKPNNAKEAISFVRQYITPSKLIVSIMAGITTQKIEQLFEYSKPLQIVRAMPNTPALFAQGAIGYSFNKIVNISNREFTSVLFSAIGIAIEVKENKLDIITALSGSGPAYIFYFAEAMIEAGQKLGLDEELSEILVMQTIFGAGQMLKNSKEKPSVLRERVTSKGGTTEQAIQYFENKNFKKIVKLAIEKAKNRSIELSKE